MECYVCPHRCGVDRPMSINDTDGMLGSCRMAHLPMISRAGVHMWEEPCISGTKGSGTVFFTGCNLHCVFCQNSEISGRQSLGKEITVEKLKEIYGELIDKGVHNINLVTPTHFSPAIKKSLEEKLPVPVVYNTSGFETRDNLAGYEGKVQIYLPDLKFYDDVLAIKYCNAPNYWRTATEAIKIMFEQTGPFELDEEGIMQKGVVIRHLMMPGCVEDSKKVIDWVAENFKPGEVMFSLMHQYVPMGTACNYPEINRKITDEEYQEVEDYLFDSGIEDGFVQDGEAADCCFVPVFDYK